MLINVYRPLIHTVCRTNTYSVWNKIKRIPSKHTCVIHRPSCGEEH